MARRKKAEMNGEPEGNGVAVAEEPQATHDTTGAEEKVQPAHVVKLRNVRIAIWANARADGSVWYSCSPSRSYRAEDGSWHTSENFGVQDLLILAEASRLAFNWIVATTQGETPF
jgi:hypothetical protein